MSTEPTNLGFDIEVQWMGDELLWKHPECRAWSRVTFPPHVLVSREPLTVTASLLCPQGCGRHGFITNGKWVPA